MRRTIERELELWKNKATRKPLLLSGVRQSGKTYLLRQLFGPLFPAVHYFDLERNKAASSVFQQDSLEPKDLIRALETLCGQRINVDTDLIILDEIQDSSRALTSLKYFAQVYHSRLWSIFGEYLAVGGMQEVVNCYKELREHSSLEAMSEVNLILSNIITGYLGDIAKHTGSVNSMHITEILKNIPAQLAAREGRGRICYSIRWSLSSN